jgi:hypothetical protein
MRYHVEYTDTFGGEANYSWVRRAIIELPDDATDRSIVIKAKAALGITGVKCQRESLGETIVLKPCGACTIIFITFGGSAQ